MASTQPPVASAERERIAPWRDVRVQRIVGQAAFLAAIAALFLYLGNNLTTNLRRSNLPTGFRFLNAPTNFQIEGSTLSPSAPIRQSLLYGYGQTVRLALAGIVIMLVIGLLVGVGRLSTNFLVRKSAAAYVELLRNIPVLVWIMFAFFAIALELPEPSRSIEFFGLAVFNVRAMFIAWFNTNPGAEWYALVLLVGLLAALAVGRWRTRQHEATGVPHRRMLWSGGTFLLVAAIGYGVIGTPIEPTFPTRDGVVVTGGLRVGVAFGTVIIMLGLYHASHTAEIIRASIQAVHKGQSEAASALALSGFQRLRYVVLPQAMRIAVPPLGNELLNLTKNTSLATAIGATEYIRITQTMIGYGQPALQLYLILMGAYLSMTLTIAVVVNIVNRRLRLEAR